MPAVNLVNRSLVGAAALATLLASAAPASAARHVNGGSKEPSSSSSNANASGQDLSASAAVKINTDNNAEGPSAGPLAPVSNWKPPACWYAPTYSPAQFKKMKEHTWSLESTGYQWDAQQRSKYAEGKPYKDFNKAKAGKGFWWTSDVNRSFPPGWDSCKKDEFWVDTGKKPPVPADQAASTPEDLAHIAYGFVHVPDTKVTLAPSGATKVNLPTWAWLNKADFKPVSVTATLANYHISSTVTATPQSLKLEPGTGDADLFPSSGVCPLVNDAIGSPYEAGDANKTPPCGVTYLRASGSNGPFQLKATITWKITWTGTGVPGGTLPSGSFGTTQDVTVDEIQAINR
ncbi:MULTISPECIES: hypothetical protein [unclassified Streptomyces]|uniref:hypothetical protein n=1 Tax=unclassified Streptomyces TaxID=2593676 RepID=UPI002E1E81ED|nr:hypothetical protein OG217_15800 [Streptomyces sp. NBC_01023]